MKLVSFEVNTEKRNLIERFPQLVQIQKTYSKSHGQVYKLSSTNLGSETKLQPKLAHNGKVYLTGRQRRFRPEYISHFPPFKFNKYGIHTKGQRESEF
jgi:hypothetical protein